MHALADPTRRAIFELLRSGPRSVGRLAECLPVSRPAVSQHLKVLAEAGLVEATPAGTRRVYAIKAEGLAELRDWIEAMWDRVLDRFDHAAREEKGRMPEHSIPPVVKRRVVPIPPEAAFELFTDRIFEWWPVTTHSISEAPVAVSFDGRVGGRVVETGPDGTEWAWADVLAWNPPRRFVLSWHPNPHPEAASILEVRFAAVGEGSEIVLEHRGWEEFADRGEELRGGYDRGWEGVLDLLVAAARP